MNMINGLKKNKTENSSQDNLNLNNVYIIQR